MNPTEKLGVAFGGVPFAVLPNSHIAIGFHCKTVNAPQSVILGRSDRGDVLRPSPFQLKRVSKENPSLLPRAKCVGMDANSLVAVDGIQDNKPRKIGAYNPAEAIPLTINIDQQGARVEEVVLYEVESFEKAKSVFADGAFVVVEIGHAEVFIEGKKIPLNILKAWADGDDSEPVNHESNFYFNGRAINMVVPAAKLVLFLMKIAMQTA